MLAPSAVLFDGTSTWVELEGHAPDVDAELTRLQEIGSFEAVSGIPELPPHRWSFTPAEALAIDPAITGSYVSVVGLGLVFASQTQPNRTVTGAVQEVHERVKANFDPTGRLNPGRNPANK